MGYNYKKLRADIDTMDTLTGVIGQSVEGRKLYYIKLGEGDTKVFLNGAHHGLEWLTSKFLMRFAKDVLKNKNGYLLGYDLITLLNEKSIYIVPMVNPDGVERAVCGGKPYKNVWQANARGVDLNHNYNALWERAKALEPENGIYGPGPTRYGGEAPESEPESRCVADFTRICKFDMVIALHSQGREIFYDFEGMASGRARDIAKSMEECSVFKLMHPTGIASYGGYKDWFIKEFGKPGYTIEIGEGKNPLPERDLPKIYKETLPVIMRAISLA